MRKSHFYGISANFCHGFMSETQVLMTVSDFLHFSMGRLFFSWGGASFLSVCVCGGGISFDGDGFQKKSWDGRGAPHYGNPDTQQSK